MIITRENAKEKLVDFIIDNKSTQVKVANGSGLSEVCISGIMRGNKPDTLTVEKINRYLKTFPDIK